MNFKKLYDDSKKQIADAIIRMWKETAPKMVELYEPQLKHIISDCISDNIVVENMAHWESADNDEDWRKIVSPNIWRKWANKTSPRNETDNKIVHKGFRPYKHQYESWKALLEDEKSIVVTSGTGSGKTECFMVPLIHDLTKNQRDGDARTEAVEAIFLYPLNALMEDQKERIDDYITFSEKKLAFAVYNGNTPEDTHSRRYDYIEVDGEVVKPYKNEMLTREEIRNNKPNILFTNPSMLEYMLLRKKDDVLFTDKLKWIVIDETHTYNGSAGAELAMLIRRVLKACGIDDPNKIKFATSSATIGDDPDAEQALIEFISSITGQKKENIKRITGCRSTPKAGSEYALEKKLKDNDFILLNELITEGRSINSKLEELDTLADKGLRVRLHYYLQALNLGLYVDPRQVQDDKFLLTRDIPIVDGKLDTHFLDAYYCKECGALLGYGEVENNKYRRRVKDELASLEEFGEDDDDDDDDSKDTYSDPSESSEFYVGLSACNKDGNANDLKWELSDDGDSFCNGGNTFKKKQVETKMVNGKSEKVHYCPCCGAHGSGKNKPMQSFHMSADFISRLIAPILLDQTSDAEPDGSVDPNRLPRQGRKYITFADSRQSVAGPTLKQNLETEEVWVTGVLYRELRNIKPLTQEEYIDLTIKKAKIEAKIEYGQTLTSDEERELQEIELSLKNNRRHNYITWNEALDILKKDENFSRMFLAFAKPDERQDKVSENKYALSALYRTMNRRPGRGSNSPENWGLICRSLKLVGNYLNRLRNLTNL